MVTSAPHYFRLIGALAPALILPADWIGGCERLDCPANGARATGAAQRHYFDGVGVLALGQSTVMTWRDYFETWAVNPHVRAEHNSDLREIARYLDHSADTSPVVIASLAAEDVEPDLFGGMIIALTLTSAGSMRQRRLSCRAAFSARYIFRPDTPLRGALSGYFTDAQIDR